MENRNVDAPIGCCGWAPQKLLIFGANRRQPTDARVVVLMRRINPFLMTVLPCTTRKPHNGDIAFFWIARGDAKQVLWDRHLSTEDLGKRPYSYVFHLHETISADKITKAGVLSQDTCMRLAQWLVRRCPTHTHADGANAK